MTPFEQSVFKTALRKLVDPAGTFYVQDFDRLMEMAQVMVSREERRPLELLHCVKYADMSGELRRQLMEQLAALLQRGRDPMYDLRDALLAGEAAALTRADMGLPESPAGMLKLLAR